MSSFYYLARGLAKLMFWLLTRWQIRGRENIPGEGPLIVVANHLHGADIPLLAISLHRQIIFMAKEELFRSWVRLVIKGCGAFPVRRGRLDRATLRQAILLLREGKVLGMFPEGTRSRSGRMQRARLGVALIACHSQASLLPVGISGTEKITGASWWLRRPQVTVNFGPPFILPYIPGRPNKEALASLTATIMGHVAELLPPEHRGVYGEAQPTQHSATDVALGLSKGDSFGS